MKNIEFFSLLRDLDDKYLISAKSLRKRKKVGKNLLAVAACAVVLIGAGIWYSRDNQMIELPRSSDDVSAMYVSFVPESDEIVSLVPLTENEIFNKNNTTIIRGTVNEVRNIEIDFAGEKEYRAIASIEVNKVLRGDCIVGETITMLLPGPVYGKFNTQENEVISAIKKGVEGIFMPVKFDQNSVIKENGVELYERDLADYGLLDGSRYAFLDIGNIIYSKDSFSGLADVDSLDAIEDYIYKMIGR